MKTKVALFSLCALASIMPQTARQLEARENSLSGGGSVSYEIYNQHGDATQAAGQSNNNNYSRVIINPTLTIKSLADKNAIELTYTPSLIYGDGGNGNIQQAGKINTNWSPSSHWNIAVSDNYQETDTDLNNINRAGFNQQPSATPGDQQGNGAASGSQTSQGASTSQTASNSQLTSQAGSQKYSNNTFNADATYKYWEDSFFKFGYELDRLRYDDLVGSNQDFDRHTFFANIRHRLNSQYSLAAAASYVRGISDQAGPAITGGASNGFTTNATNGFGDVDELHLSTSVESMTIPHHPLSLTYSLDTSNYDDERQADSQIHTLLLGWTWEISEKAKFSLSGGPIYQKSDGSDDSWSYALNASYSRQWSATGQITFNVAHGMETRNFSGNKNDNGMTEYWRAGVGISQALSENLSLNLMATVADEDVTQPNSFTANGLGSSSHNIKQYTLGGGLSYNFARWYSLGLNYSYTTQNGNLPGDNYDEYRLMLVLSMQRDFLHW